MASFAKRTFVNVPADSTDYEIVVALPGKRIRVLQVILVSGGDATDATFGSTDGVTLTISPLFANASNGGAVLPHSPVGWFETRTGEALTVTTSAGSTVGVLIGYETN